MALRPSTPPSRRFWWKGRRCRPACAARHYRGLCPARGPAQRQMIERGHSAAGHSEPASPSRGRSQADGRYPVRISSSPPGSASMSQARPAARQEKSRPIRRVLPSVNVTYSDSRPDRAQKICNAMTSLILNENLKQSRRQVCAKARPTFLSRQVEDAKQRDRRPGCQAGGVQEAIRWAASRRHREQHAHPDVAEFAARREHPEPESRRSRIRPTPRACWRSRLAAWKSSQSSTNPQTLETTVNASCRRNCCNCRRAIPTIIRM